jgi:hypothetical protein
VDPRYIFVDENTSARLEAPLIERYHAGLLAHGVTDYGLDQLREDH